MTEVISQHRIDSSIELDFFTTLSRAPYTLLTGHDWDLDNSESSLIALCTVALVLIGLVPQNHWTAETHRAILDSTPSKVFKKELYHYLRRILLGDASGTGISETLIILHRKESL
jgi:hypothetical protein